MPEPRAPDRSGSREGSLADGAADLARSRATATSDPAAVVAWLTRVITCGEPPAASARGTNAPAWPDPTAGDVSVLVEAADAHGVSALVWDALATARGAAAQMHEALGPRVRAAAARDVLLQHELTRVLDACAGAGVEVLPIKGAALAYTAYLQPWHRPRTDADLLVAPSAVTAAAGVLEASGYHRSDAVSTGAVVSHQAVFERTDGRGVHHVIDLHWRIVNPHLLARSLEFEALWARAEAVPALGPAARVPSRVDAALIACIHRLAHHHGHERLVWLYDVRLLSEGFAQSDWEQVCERAERAGVAGLCLDGLRHARDAVGGSLPPVAETSLALAAAAEESRMYLRDTVHRRDVLVSDLTTLPTWRAKLQLICEHAFPPPAFLLQRYRVRNRAWLPALYAHRLLTGARKWWC